MDDLRQDIYNIEQVQFVGFMAESQGQWAKLCCRLDI